MTSSQFFNITTIAYFASMVLFITYLISRSRGISLIATAVAGIGFVANSAAILMRWFEAKGMGYDQAPLSNLHLPADGFQIQAAGGRRVCHAVRLSRHGLGPTRT